MAFFLIVPSVIIVSILLVHALANRLGLRIYYTTLLAVAMMSFMVTIATTFLTPSIGREFLLQLGIMIAASSVFLTLANKFLLNKQLAEEKRFNEEVKAAYEEEKKKSSIAKADSFEWGDERSSLDEKNFLHEEPVTTAYNEFADKEPSTTLEDNFADKEPSTTLEDNLDDKEPSIMLEDNLADKEPSTTLEDNLDDKEPLTTTEDNIADKEPSTTTEDNLDDKEPLTTLEGNIADKEPSTTTEDNLDDKEPSTTTEDNLDDKESSTTTEDNLVDKESSTMPEDNIDDKEPSITTEDNLDDKEPSTATEDNLDDKLEPVENFPLEKVFEPLPEIKSEEADKPIKLEEKPEPTEEFPLEEVFKPLSDVKPKEVEEPQPTKSEPVEKKSKPVEFFPLQEVFRPLSTLKLDKLEEITQEEKNSPHEDEPQSIENDTLDDILDKAYNERDKGHVWQAIELYKKALERYRNDEYAPFVAIDLGNLYKEEALYSKAIKIYEEALRLPAVKRNSSTKKDFKNNLDYLRIVRDVLLRHHMLSVPFGKLPKEILQEVDTEFKKVQINSAQSK